MTAFMLQAIPSFHAKIQKKSFFISENTFEKYIVCKDYCIAHHDDMTCFLPACKDYFILLGGTEELLHKLDTFCFTYRHVDCLYTLFRCRFTGKCTAKSEIVFDNVQRAFSFNQRNRGMDKLPSIAKERLLRKSLNNIL